jgi:exonuclease SbcD
MKILLIGDLHLRAKRMNDVAAAWNKTVTWAHSNKVDLIVQAGDVFDHANVYGKEANVGTIYDAFVAPYKTYAHPIRTFLIPGNHDMGGPLDVDALAPFTTHGDIIVSRIPEVVEVTNELSICSMPWVNRAQLLGKLTKRGESLQAANDKVDKAIGNLISKLAPKVKEQKEKSRFVLFVGHIEITNAKMAGGKTQAGGAFEFNATDLASLGCDAYALAHIHVRQHIPGLPNPNDGYIGSLCQLSFDEEGQDPGCRLIEFDKDRHIIRDEWIDNEESPKYFTVESMAGLEYRPGIDLVKMKGEIRPESLPPGVIFEKIPSTSTMKRMTSEHLDSTTPLRKLLSVWKDYTNCPISLDTLTAAAEHLQSKAQLPADAIGSLDCIDGITLQNITCHKSTNIDLDGVRGICALEGPNGSGKTTAIEAIPLAFFGHAPSRKDLPSLLPLDSDGIGVIEVAFRSAGKKYLARRSFKKTPKTFKQEAYLFAAEDYNAEKPDYDKAQAGPKVEDVKNRCITLIGDPALVFAGIFSSQNESGDLVDLDPSERKELFAKLLGSEKYLKLSEIAKEKASADNAIIESHRARIERLKIELADEENDEMTIKTLKIQIATLNESIESENEAATAAQETLAGLEVLRKDRDKSAAALAEVSTRKEEIKTEGTLVKSQKAKYEAAEANIKEMEATLSSAREAKEKLDEINAKLADNNKQVSELKQKANGKTIEAAKVKAAYDDQVSKWALKKAHAINELKTKRASGKKPLEKAVNDLSLEVQAKRTEAENAKKRAKLLEGFPDVEACRTCPLAKDGIEGRDSLAEIVKAGKALVKKLDEAKAALEEYDVETASLEEKQASLAPTSDDIDESLQSKAKVLTDESLVLLNESTALAESVAQVGKPVAALKQLAAGAKAAEQGLDEAKGARVEIAKWDAKLESLRTEYKKRDDQSKSIIVPEIPDDAAARAAVNAIRVKIKELQAGVAAGSRALGTAEATIAAHQKRRDEVITLAAGIKEKDDAIGVYNALHKAFGKDGIPQLIVDSAVPHYQDIMTELMTHFGSKWSIQASTQKEVNKGASIKEVFDIIVDDGHGGRDIKTYSGGEKRLLKNVTRVAFSLLQAERSGKGLKVLVLDEATENMDHVNIDSFMKMLKSKSDQFSQIFVISHNDYVLSAMPNRILFNRNGWPNEWTTVDTSFSVMEKTSK